jgi:hypothetical protein
MNITYTLPMKSQYSLKIYELCKSYQNLYITKKEKGEPLVWNIETLKKQVDCNAANWAHVRRTVLDTATPTSILTMRSTKKIVSASLRLPSLLSRWTSRSPMTS